METSLVRVLLLWQVHRGIMNHLVRGWWVSYRDVLVSPIFKHLGTSENFHLCESHEALSVSRNFNALQGKALRKERIVQLLQEPVLCACHHYNSKRQFSATSTNLSCVISLEHPMVPYFCWLILWILLKVMTVKVPCAYFLASTYRLGVRCAKQFSFSYFWSHQCLSIDFWQCSFTWSCYV